MVITNTRLKRINSTSPKLFVITEFDSTSMWVSFFNRIIISWTLWMEKNRKWLLNFDAFRNLNYDGTLTLCLYNSLEFILKRPFHSWKTTTSNFATLDHMWLWQNISLLSHSISLSLTLSPISSLILSLSFYHVFASLKGLTHVWNTKKHFIHHI